ncbi:hypothetical protein QYE76_056593 [Lolium multiflorum]|uniref:Uncharacterized protein n=1 Tax=Lolium multiflorum TaxID=4521 RepID=A0AAD8T2I9_LOLMU|nr:hypothetical protein QYE76_056593 [Lolium multiflorum]
MAPFRLADAHAEAHFGSSRRFRGFESGKVAPSAVGRQDGAATILLLPCLKSKGARWGSRGDPRWAHLIGRRGPRPGRAAREEGAHSPLASFSSRTSSSRKPKPQRIVAKSHGRLCGGEHQREKSSRRAGIRGNSLPEGEIDAIVTVIELDIISITIVIISIIITAISTAAPRHRCNNSAAGGTFMSITLGTATKLLDNMMINYSEWHTERAPQGKKVNSVEETSSLSNKIDVIMSMLVNGRSNVDPNNVPLASLVAQEENVDVNFIKSNNFNNNAYRNNSGNNYRPYPSNNGNGYGNFYGNYYNNNRSVPSGLEAMLKEFISTQTAFNKSVGEKLDKIDILASKVDSLAADVDLLKLKVMPNEDKDIKSFDTANAIQVRINENIRLMAELHARWEREENEKLAKENNVAKVWTITTTSNVDAPHVAKPPTINDKIIGVGNVSTPSAKRAKLPETAETICDKTAEIFQNIGDNDPIAVDHNGLDFDDCHISEVIKFLQKLARSPNASAINLAFTKHITNALIKAREDKLKLETSIPRKLEDGWEPIIKMKVNDFVCNALCDLSASISVMPKKIYDMLDLPPLKNCYLDVNLADNAIKKPLGRIDNVRIMVNNNLVPVDFVILDIECNASCPIILGRPFLRTVGATTDMEEGEKKDFVLETLLKEFGDVAREDRKVFIEYKMLGLYTNFANTLEKMEKDRLKYTNEVNCEGYIKTSIPYKLLGMFEALEKNYGWIVPENLFDENSKPKSNEKGASETYIDKIQCIVEKTPNSPGNNVNASSLDNT